MDLHRVCLRTDVEASERARPGIAAWPYSIGLQVVATPPPPPVAGPSTRHQRCCCCRRRRRCSSTDSAYSAYTAFQFNCRQPPCTSSSRSPRVDRHCIGRRRRRRAATVSRDRVPGATDLLPHTPRCRSCCGCSCSCCCCYSDADSVVTGASSHRAADEASA